MSHPSANLEENYNGNNNGNNTAIITAEEVMEGKTWKSELWKGVSWCTFEEYKAYGIKDKVLYGLIWPVITWMRLTVPLLDEDDMNKSWNKPQAIIQVRQFL